MTSVPSKRQQARNEKALQELVQSVSGNNACADCKTRNPGVYALLTDISAVYRSDTSLSVCFC